MPPFRVFPFYRFRVQTKRISPKRTRAHPAVVFPWPLGFSFIKASQPRPAAVMNNGHPPFTLMKAILGRL